MVPLLADARFPPTVRRHPLMPPERAWRMDLRLIHPSAWKAIFRSAMREREDFAAPLGPAPRLLYLHRSELLQDAKVVPASGHHLRNLAFGEAQGGGTRPPHLSARRRDDTSRALRRTALYPMPYDASRSPPAPPLRVLFTLVRGRLILGSIDSESCIVRSIRVGQAAYPHPEA